MNGCLPHRILVPKETWTPWMVLEVILVSHWKCELWSLTAQVHIQILPLLSGGGRGPSHALVSTSVNGCHKSTYLVGSVVRITCISSRKEPWKTTWQSSEQEILLMIIVFSYVCIKYQA